MNHTKHIIFLAFFLISGLVKAQDFSELWEGHYSYLDIKDISQGTEKIYGAAENAIFIYDINTEELEKISSINGLSGETISSIEYIESEGLLLIGYENGLIQVYNESSEDILSVVDIIEKATIPPNAKRINHFNIYEGLAYISTDYGISVYDILNLEFGDTYYIGPGGSQIIINQTTIFNEYIYTASPTGVKRALVANPNLIDFQQWENLYNGIWIQIEALGEALYLTRNNKRIYDISSGTLDQKAVYQERAVDLRTFDDKLIVTTKDEVYVYDNTFTQLSYATVNADYNTNFTSASISVNDELFIGTISIVNTGEPGYGILYAPFSDTSVYQEIHPGGPLKNKVFQIDVTPNEIWAVHGGHSVTYNFNGGARRTGISHFNGEEWVNFPFPDIEDLIFRPWYLSYVAINPLDTEDVYVSSYFSGLINLKASEINTIYDQNNSTIVPFAASLHLTLANYFDEEGILWVMNGRTDTSLNKFENDQWTSFSLSEVITAPTSNLGFSSLVKDDQGNLFMGSHGFGLIAFNENNGNPIFSSIVGEDNNMPSPSVKTVTIDNSGQLWLGTDKGLRVVFNTSNFMDNPEVDEIIIIDDDIPKELLFQQYVSDIEVDGSNNKWIATLDTGLFYLSSDGQETIHHFTKDNSPLPTNDILDVSIDNTNGIVYIATDKGLLSYKSDGSKPKDNLEDAFVFPNPVRPTFNIVEEKIKIKDISDNVNIKITDIEGNLVAEAESRTNSRFKGYNLEIDGGTALWNGKNLADRVVASGVYLVMLSDLDTFETKVLKVMIVR